MFVLSNVNEFNDLSKCLIVNKEVAALLVKCDCLDNMNACHSGCEWTGTLNVSFYLQSVLTKNVNIMFVLKVLIFSKINTQNARRNVTTATCISPVKILEKMDTVKCASFQITGWDVTVESYDKSCRNGISQSTRVSWSQMIRVSEMAFTKHTSHDHDPMSYFP
jgi:hypothetical protein